MQRSSYIQSDLLNLIILKMGNEVCKVVQSERKQLFKDTLRSEDLSENISIKYNQSKTELSSSLKRQKTQMIHLKKLTLSQNGQKQFSQNHVDFGEDMIEVKYKEYLIKCNKSNVTYINSNLYIDKIPLINGVVEAYKKSSASSSNYHLLYEGEMKKSKFDGFGKLYDKSQLIYEGEFKFNKYDGWGITVNYQGQFREGKFDGYGIYKQFQKQHNNKFVNFYYEGYFQNGTYSGSGVQIKGGKWPIAEVNKIHNFDGIFQYLNKQIEHSFDIIKKYRIKDIYIGQFSNGYCHGFGRHITQNHQFSGQFSCNMYHGLGTIYNNSTQGQKVIQAVFKMGESQK